MENKEKITYFGQTDARGRKAKFGIKATDRTRHMYVIGKTGMGKSTMLENLAVQDIANGEGFAFIDPHGKTADLLLDYIPENRIKDIVYFAPFDINNPIAFNIMEDVGADKRHLVAAGLMSAFKKIWVDMWSARMEYILGNVIMALLEYPGATMLSINRMLTDKDYRKAVVANITDPSTKSFWVDEYSKYTDRYTADATPAIQNKVGQFTANPLIRNMVGQTHSSFDIRKMMDEKKILIVNLSKGQIGEGNANLLGSMIITKIYLAAMSRADVSEKEMQRLPNFYLYVDEFQSFANESFADILSEARKYRLNLTIAHQYIEQMSEEVRAAVFGNVGTMVTFRVGAYDADVLEKEFAPVFVAEDLVNLGFTQIYLKLMIDGIGSHPFSATTMPPIEPPLKSNKEEVIKSSRELFSHPKKDVEEFINKWYEPVSMPKVPAVKKDTSPLQNNSKNEFIGNNTVSSSQNNATTQDKKNHSVVMTKPQYLQNRRKDDFKLKENSPVYVQKRKTDTITYAPLSVLENGIRATPQKKDISAGRVLSSNIKRNEKGPTPEKIKSLKDALDEAFREKSQVNNSGSNMQDDMPVPMPNKRKEYEKEKSNLEQKIKEVPEETLKKILE